MAAITGLVDYLAAKSGLDEMYPKTDNREKNQRREYHADYATILCFLSDRVLFERLFREMSDDLGQMYKFRKETLHVHNRLTAAFVDLFQILNAADGRVRCEGFKNGHESRVVLSNKVAQNVTLTGNAANLFGKIVSNGYLFKDGTGPSHGEYAHSFQWLTIAYARYYETIELKHGITELYKGSVGFLSEAKLFTLDADSDTRIQIPLPYWSHLVDCFRSGELHGLAEDFGKNLFVENYRSPNYLTDQMLHRRLSNTFAGEHLQKRYAHENRRFGTGKRQRDTVRERTFARQKAKKAVLLSGKTTNATRPYDRDDGLSSDLRGQIDRFGGRQVRKTD